TKVLPIQCSNIRSIGNLNYKPTILNDGYLLYSILCSNNYQNQKNRLLELKILVTPYCYQDIFIYCSILLVSIIRSPNLEIKNVPISVTIKFEIKIATNVGQYGIPNTCQSINGTMIAHNSEYCTVLTHTFFTK